MQASDRHLKTGSERPHKKTAKFDPFRTSRAAGPEKPETVQFCIISFMGLCIAALPRSKRSR